MGLKYKIFRYGLLRRLKKGNRHYIFPTLRCNLDCDYCFNKSVPVRKKYSEMKFMDWKQIIDSWENVQEIFLSGGEPFIYPDILPLLEYLIDKKYMITINTNLLKLPDEFIKPTLRLRIVATYHLDLNGKSNKFVFKYYHLKNLGHNVIVEKFNKSGNNQISFGNAKHMYVEKDELLECLVEPIHAYAPDGTLTKSRYELLTGVEYECPDLL